MDDDEIVLEMTAEMLKGLGYRVKSRHNSIEALNAFRTNPVGFDLAITDQTMPNMSGNDLAKKFSP